MKVLIIGANSDISRNLIENNKTIDFIELTSSEAYLTKIMLIL